MVLSASKLKERLQDCENALSVARDILRVSSVVAHIYRKVVNVLVEVAEDTQVVGRSLLNRRYGVLADVATENDILVFVAHICQDALQALVGEAHAVENGSILVEREHSWTRVALLWARCHGANLHKAEAQRIKRAEDLSVAVKARSHTYRVAEAQTKDLALQRWRLNAIYLAQKPIACG